MRTGFAVNSCMLIGGVVSTESRLLLVGPVVTDERLVAVELSLISASKGNGWNIKIVEII